MKVGQLAPHAVLAAASGMAVAMGGIKRFAKLERVLAAVCALTPALLIAADGGAVRESISAYYDMPKSQFFYVPLTMAAMLFIVNGLVKEQRTYNTFLGVMLAGLLLANRTDASTAHTIFAAAFFLGNAAVMVVHSPRRERWFKILLVAVILAALAAWKPLGLITLFWAEWLSLLIIAAHYILESIGLIR